MSALAQEQPRQRDQRGSTQLAVDDAVLVERARQDPAAFADLYRRYVNAVYRYCYGRLGAKEAAEDATSHTFERALKALPRYHHESFRGWLFTIAHNVIVNDQRTHRGLTTLNHESSIVDPTAGPEEKVLAHDASTTLHDLLNQLPPDQRQLLDLRLAGLSGPEIAQVLGRSHGAVKVAQFRAVARLRGLLNNDNASGASDNDPR